MKLTVIAVVIDVFRMENGRWKGGGKYWNLEMGVFCCWLEPTRTLRA